MHSSSELVLLETEFWRVIHRPDTVLPGYLLMQAQQPTTHLWELDPKALEEMGRLLSQLQKLLMHVLKPEYLHIGRYGYLQGPSFHFHLIPIYEWVVKGFLADERYRLLQQFQYACSDRVTASSLNATEIQLYVWREFCENPVWPPLQGFSVMEAMDLLRKGLYV